MNSLATESRPIDLARIDDATGGDAEFLAELVEIFVEDALLRLDELAQAFESGDPSELRKTAHKLKGSSANMGAHGLTSLAKALEDMGQAGEVNNAEDHLEALQTEFHRVKSALEQLVAEGA